MTTASVFDRNHLVAGISKLSTGRVLILGDAMLDEYFSGDAERISPEAPVPVVRVHERRLLLGGAGNVARNIASLGGHVELIGIVGNDSHGDILGDTLRREGITANLLGVKGRPTTLKTRVIARNQQMLRIDHEDISPLSPATVRELLDTVASVIDGYDVLIISDYGKGVVSKELLDGVHAIRNASTSRPKILVDPKTPNFSLYTDVHLLTPNAKETSEGAHLPAQTPEEILLAGKAIFRKLRCEHLLTTLGNQGMAFFVSEDEAWHIPTVAQKVFDVTGAGDTVIATLALCLAAGSNHLNACILANYAAGIVVGEVGAAVVTQKQLRHVLETTPEPAISRW